MGTLTVRSEQLHRLLTFAVPQGGLTLLNHIALGRSPWAGLSEGGLAERRALIFACRDCGLTTPENHLTDLGRDVLKLLGAEHG